MRYRRLILPLLVLLALCCACAGQETALQADYVLYFLTDEQTAHGSALSTEPYALPGEEAGMTYWTLLMPIQQLIAISICLGVLVGMRWGGSLGLAVGGAGVVLGLMLLAVTGLPFLLFPACLLLYGAVLLLSFTGRARKAWEEYRQGNTPEL